MTDAHPDHSRDARDLITGLTVLPGREGKPALCLVTGATGYIGGRLVPVLLDLGYRVRVLARHPERLRDHPWVNDVDVVAGDATDADAMQHALADVDVAYYLLHSLQMGDGFEELEQRTAQTFAGAAADAQVRRIVYLGGLVPSNDRLSPHLASRAAVGDLLRASGVPTAELRAGVVIGSGSASFEMLRYLTERLPMMVTPRWVNTHIQPIAVRDVLRLLAGAAALPDTVNRPFDIGGPDVITYADMMQRYAAAAGLRKRVIVPVPVLSPTLSSHWVGFVTPVPAAIAKPLVKSLRNEVVCHEDDIANYIADPPGGRIGFDRAVSLALTRIRDADVTTRWSQASVPGAPSDPLPTDPAWAGGSLYEDKRSSEVAASAADTWKVVESIGGETGYFSMDFAWWIRGVADRMIGGVGLRRGRRDPETLMVGEALDFWRVEERDPPRLLRLRAEMKLPGLAWLEFVIEANDPHSCTLNQRAVFYPRGLAGHAYWWSVAPFHGIVFRQMNTRMARTAEQSTGIAGQRDPAQVG